ncbi:MAG: AAA family ATPase [Steroidobacteraceae bacterium]
MPARIVVLAGVNGAGKSTVAGAAIVAAGGAFFNPDEAARAARQENPGLTVAQANASAWEMGRRGLARAIQHGEFFAFETTLGGHTIFSLLRRGAELGAEIHMSYVGLRSEELHIQRVKSRVAAGGHDIAEAKIRERYRTSREHLIALLALLATLRVYDNSDEADPKTGATPRPVLLLHMQRGRVEYHAALNDMPDWIKPILGAAL